MRRKAFPRSSLILAIASSLSYPGIFALIYGATYEIVLCSIVHALCAALIMYWVVSDLFLRKNNGMSMAGMFLLVNLVYLNASSIKYHVAELYPGFISDNYMRLFYSLLAAGVLALCYKLIIRLGSRFGTIQFTIRSPLLLNASIVFIMALVVLDVMTNYGFKGFGYAYHSDSDPLQLALERIDSALIQKIGGWFLDNLKYILIGLVALAFSIKSCRIYVPISIGVFFLASVVSGSRSLVFYYLIGIIFAIHYLYGTGNKIIARILLMSPALMAAGSMLILMVAGRTYYGDREELKHQLAYRFDLTDYAATIIDANGGFVFNKSHLVDAVYYSIPQFIYPDKYTANKNVALQELYEASLDEESDFTDTFFSIGAQTAGITGFIVFPFLMVVTLHLLERFLHRKMPTCAHLAVISMIQLYITIETDLNNLLGEWRMLPLYIAFGWILAGLLLKGVLPTSLPRIRNSFRTVNHLHQAVHLK